MTKNRKEEINISKTLSDWPEDVELVKCAVCGTEGFISRSGQKFKGCRMVFNDDGQIVCDFCRPPSKATDGYWIFASRKKGKYPRPTPKSGKWLIFVNEREVDAAWAKIKRAVEEGRLGQEVKVSTPKPKPADIGYKKAEHVICVYTYDWTDKKDVKRIREELRKLGITNKIPYKADDDPRYAARGDKGISRYYE